MTRDRDATRTFYRRLIRLYPRHFRDRFADESRWTAYSTLR